MSEEITQEEAQANHDAWWNSLTEEQKQQLYNNQEEAFQLTIEEMNYKIKQYLGGLAQLARALALHARGHQFDSDILHIAPIAQLARAADL